MSQRRRRQRRRCRSRTHGRAVCRLDRESTGNGVGALADAVGDDVTHLRPGRTTTCRESAFERADSPNGHRWTVVLRADGSVVSKFGQFETIEMSETVESLVQSMIRSRVRI
ncbi:hypothetical protein C9J85_15095 [Haloferax sp. wsp5]|nr:hypothetical protein C9J85_15095 [Haloferax sp. wsp5]